MAADPLQEEALDRLERSRARKADVTPDLMEGYFFTNPRRARDVQSQIQAATRTTEDQNELQTTIGTECAQDFGALVVNTFMPANFPWCRRGRGALPEEQWDQIKEEVEIADETVLAAVRASNFDATAYQSFNPDLSIGVSALWIDEDELWKLPRCKAVPLRKLEIDLGPDGEVGPRFMVDHICGRDMLGAVGRVVYDKIPDKILRKMKAQPKTTLEVVWALWPDYDKRGTETWYHCVLIDKTIIHKEMYEGEGSCPLIVTPWAPGPDSPWGDGPALCALPYLRVVDQLAGETIDMSSIRVSRPISYPHDGTLNFENGIESGKAYPHAPGTMKEEFVDLAMGAGETQEGLFTVDYLERGIKRLWFADRPEQVGKTPPTATQWLDELVDRQKRIGLVGQRFWRDGPRAYFNRFKYILEKRGLVQKFPGLPLEPYNPAVKGQEYQEVQVSAQLLQMILAYGGVQGQALIDVQKTFKAIKEKLGDKVVAFNTPEQMAGLLAQILPQAAGAGGGGGMKMPGG